MWSKIAKVLLAVGGLNWGLVGVGMLMAKELNVVNMLLGTMPNIEALVYVLVGLSALMYLIGCKCRKCRAACETCAVPPVSNSAGQM